MDDFLLSYLVLSAIALLAFLGFWGVVIYLVIGFFQEKPGISTKQKLGMISAGKQSNSSHERREILIDSEVGRMAIQDGMDLNEIRL